MIFFFFFQGLQFYVFRRSSDNFSFLSLGQRNPKYVKYDSLPHTPPSDSLHWPPRLTTKREASANTSRLRASRCQPFFSYQLDTADRLALTPMPEKRWNATFFVTCFITALSVVPAAVYEPREPFVSLARHAPTYASRAQLLASPLFYALPKVWIKVAKSEI